MTHRGKPVKVVKSVSFSRMLILATNWRKQVGGIVPANNIEEHQRNIIAYCNYAHRLN